ncbi:MAG: glycosyltransferase family 2 protein [Methanobacteriaceae archaeon]
MDSSTDITNTNINSNNGINFNNNIFIIVPAFNEEKTVYGVISELIKSYNVILVDDGSRDNTFDIVKNIQSKNPDKLFIYSHVINRGLGAALKTGMNAAIKNNADYVVTFDADGQHAIEDVDKVVTPLINGEADVVIGARPFEDMPLTKNFANSVMNILTRIFYRANVKDSQSGMRAFKKDIIPKINIMSRGYGVSSEFFREIRRNHLKLAEVTITTIYTPETQEKGTNAIVGIKILFKMIVDFLIGDS